MTEETKETKETKKETKEKKIYRGAWKSYSTAGCYGSCEMVIENNHAKLLIIYTGRCKGSRRVFEFTMKLNQEIRVIGLIPLQNNPIEEISFHISKYTSENIEGHYKSSTRNETGMFKLIRQDKLQSSEDQWSDHFVFGWDYYCPIL